VSFFSFFGFLGKATGRTVGPIWTNEGSKRVVPLKEVPFRGPKDVSLNFGGKIPKKNWNFGDVNRTLKPEREKIQILITWKLLSNSWQNFYRRHAPWMRLREWSHGSPQQIQNGGGRHLLFWKKISISPDWIKISAPNFMGRRTKAVRRWPRDQKLKPEVNSRDVIEWKSEA